MKIRPSYLSVLIAAASGLTQSTAVFAEALEEIVVTATKVAQSQQDVPLAITAFNASAMEQRGITETSEISGMVPSLVVSSPFGRTQPNFALRGISVANEFNPNAASPIGVYVNEDYKQFRPTHGMQLFDLDRIEVIRGPQGTLFGRNTTGGAISIHTVMPEMGDVGEFSGYLKGKYGNYNRWTVEGAAETTLIEDKLAVRVAATRNQGDGHIENKTPKFIPSLTELGTGSATKPVDALTDKDYASVDDAAQRITLLMTPTDDLMVTFMYTHGEAEPIGPASSTNFWGGAGNTNVFGYNNEMYGAGGEDEGAADQTGKYESGADDVNLTVNWDLSDSLSLTSITGYLEGDMLVPRDCDGVAAKICFVEFKADFRQFNQDLRLTWIGDNSRLIVGAYYGTDSVDSQNDEMFFEPTEDLAAGFFNPPIESWIALGNFVGDPLNPFATATGFRALSNFTQERDSQALYAEGNYEFTDDLSVTLGVRYTKDDFELSNLRSTIYDLTTNTPQYNAIPLNPVPDLNQTLDPLKADSGEYTGRLLVDYHLADDVMLFTSFSRGYRAGTFNGKASQAVSQVTFVEPEFVNNIELGIKSRFWDSRVQLNATYFYARYKDQQVQEVVGATSYLRNASGEMSGLEIEIEANVTDSVYMGLSLGLMESEYDKGIILSGYDLGGNSFPFAPDTTANLFVNWDIMELGNGTVELSGVARYQSETFFDPFNSDKTNDNGPGNSFQSQDAYTLLDARLGWKSDDLELTLWGKNLTDKFYYISGLDTTLFGSDDLIRGEPRTYGIEARYNF